MKNIFIICLLLTTSSIFAQNMGSVKGKILDIDMNNEPLLFAQVQIKNTSNKAETNFHGNFEINDIDAGDYTLVVSYIGYETIEVPFSVKKNAVTKINKGLKVKALPDFSLPSEASNEIAVVEKK